MHLIVRTNLKQGTGDKHVAHVNLYSDMVSMECQNANSIMKCNTCDAAIYEVININTGHSLT